MDEIEAKELVDKLLVDGFGNHVLLALREGIRLHADCMNGLSVLNEWHQTDVESRILSSAVLTAFDAHEWSQCGLCCERELQVSSHRSYLVNNAVHIDIIRENRPYAQYVARRMGLNRPNGPRQRYLLLRYVMDQDTLALQKVELIVPLTKAENLYKLSLEIG